LANWKLFNHSKTKGEAHDENTVHAEKIQESEEKQLKSEIREKPKEVPIKEYGETLYSKGFAQKQPTSPSLEKKQPLKRITWENAETIEHYIDNIRWKQKESKTSSNRTQVDTEKKVDFTLLRKKSKL